MRKEYCKEFLTLKEAMNFIKSLGGNYHFKKLKKNKFDRFLVYYFYKEEK